MRFRVSLVAGEARFVLRLIDWLAIDKSPNPQPPVDAYFLEFLTMI
jgi:hypothetical protein